MRRDIIAFRPSCREVTPLQYVPAMAAAPSPEGMILILGAARSGTTWLATIFDSQEDVLYRHEPDITLRRTSIPYFCGRAAIAHFRDEARSYLLQLAALSVPDTSGRPLWFRKRYRSPADCAIRMSQVNFYRALAHKWPEANDWTVADRMRKGAEARVLIKSVSACGRAGLFAEALPEARIVCVARSPFGQVASMLRGIKTGRLDSYEAMDRVSNWPKAQDYGLAGGHFQTMPLVERLAWHWVFSLEKLLDDLEGRPNVKIVAYETLCQSPLATADRLFAFAGLSMGDQTRRFIARSTRSSISASYYSVFKDPAVPANRWKLDLSAAQQTTIRSIVERTRAYEDYRNILRG